MSEVEIKHSAAPAGTAPVVVTYPTLGEVDQPSISAQSQPVVRNSNHPSQSFQSSPNGRKPRASVAAQQKSNKNGLVLAPPGMFASVDYSGHTDEELHAATVGAIAAYTQKREEADAYAYDVLVPALNQIILRYKQQGRATPYRLNGCPTVEEYFESIGLNYSTVRSWKSRAQQRLLQAAADAGTKPAPARDPNPIPHFNKAETKAMIEGNHRAVEIVVALEAGRDAKKEIAHFKAVMNARRLDDIMQTHAQEPDYKGILMKVVQTVADMNATLPAAFVKSVRDLTKPCKFKIALATVSSRKSNGNGTPQPLQIAPIPQTRPEWLPLKPGKKYTVRPHPQGGSGVYEVGGSTVCWQKHPSQDEAWDAIEAVNVPPASSARSEMSGNADEGVSIAADSLFPASDMMREVNAPPTPGG
jgi:hypothetical protein